MTNFATIGTAGAIVGLGALLLGYQVGTSRTVETVAAVTTPSTNTGSTLDRSGIEAIVRDYLVSNPEVLVEAQTALEARRADQERIAHRDIIASHADQLFNSPMDAVFGNPDGDVTIVEFYDYNCGYCKRALPDMDALIESDPNLRFVMKEFPILGPDSTRAHIVAKAFKTLHPDEYMEFHRELLGSEGRATEETAMAVALKLGADEKQIREKMTSPDVTAAFQANYELAQALNITGTPSYILSDEVVPGAVGIEFLAEKIQNIRSGKTAAR
ncbi:MAG: DsbA family protein [Phyllobacterium sp.]